VYAKVGGRVPKQYSHERSCASPSLRQGWGTKHDTGILEGHGEQHCVLATYAWRSEHFRMGNARGNLD
jgi:hypothetical protein